VPDYLALVGDSADGIPGVPRFGARSTAAVLSRWKHLEDIPRDLSAWDIKVRGASSLLEQLRAHEDEVLLYRRLATLREDVDLPVSFEEMLYAGPKEDEVALLSEELGARL
jgi:5'-3' exonuclease